MLYIAYNLEHLFVLVDRGLRQGFGSREQRVKMDGREQGALKIPLGAGSRASRQKEQGATELLSQNIEKPIN